MRHLAVAIILFASALISGASFAADADKGVEAYLNGDFAAAIKELKPSAEQGNARAQLHLGLSYYNGHGVPQDYKQAVYWYRLAAEQGYADAQTKLGLSYYSSGRGVPQDYALAHMWLNIAAMNGDEFAEKFIDLLAKKMTPAQIAEAQSLARQCVKQNYKDCS